MAAPYESVEISTIYPSPKIGVVRLTLTGAIVAVLFFAICWVAMLLPIGGVSHAYLGLFTAAPVASVQALGEGVLWSILFGALAGGLTAFVYNALARFG